MVAFLFHQRYFWTTAFRSSYWSELHKTYTERFNRALQIFNNMINIRQTLSRTPFVTLANEHTTATTLHFLQRFLIFRVLLDNVASSLNVVTRVVHASNIVAPRISSIPSTDVHFDDKRVYLPPIETLVILGTRDVFYIILNCIQGGIIVLANCLNHFYKGPVSSERMEEHSI